MVNKEELKTNFLSRIPKAFKGQTGVDALCSVESILEHQIKQRELLKVTTDKVERSKIKNNSYYHQQAVEIDKRSSESIKENKTWFPYLVVDIDHIDLLDNDLRNKIINDFENNDSVSYIEKSISGKGLHVYIEIDKYFTHYEFRNYYLSFVREYYIKNNYTFGFIDSSLSRSVQPVYISVDKIYQNDNSKTLVVDEVIENDEVIKAIYRLKDKTFKTSDLINIESDLNRIKENSKLINKLDKKGNKIIFDNNIDVDLSDREQKIIINQLAFKHINKKHIEDRQSKGINPTFHSELLSAVFALFSRKNLRPELIIEHLESLSDNNVYRNELNNRINAINIYPWKENERQNAYFVYKKEFNIDLIKSKVKTQTINIDADYYLEPTQKIDSSMINDLDNNKTFIIADTKSGKTYSTINYFNDGNNKILFLVPTIKLRDEVIRLYSGNLFTPKTDVLKTGLNIGTYDSFIHNEYIKTNLEYIKNVKLIIDEVHTLITEDYRFKIMNQLYDFIIKNKWKTIVLMTATPINKFDGYKTITIKYKSVLKSNINFFATSFNKYIINNLDIYKNNLIYINNVEQIEKIYNHYKNKGLICKLLISDENKSFINQNNIDIKNKEYKVINTYLTTRVVEVGIGLEEFINEFYINPFSQSDFLSIQSFEQLINRDNRMNKKTGSRTVNIYFRNFNKFISPEDILKDKFNNNVLSPSYKLEMIKYIETQVKNNAVDVTFDILNFFETYLNSRYINNLLDKTVDGLLEIDNEKSKDYKEMDWNNVKQDINSISRIIDDFERKEYDREIVSNFISEWDFKTFKNVKVKTDIIYELKGTDLYFDKNIKIKNSDLNYKIEKHLIEKQKLNVDLIVETPKKLKQNVLSIHNCYQTNDIYYFSGIVDVGINSKKECKYLETGMNFNSKSEIKDYCLKNGINYKVEINNFKTCSKRNGASMIKYYKYI